MVSSRKVKLGGYTKRSRGKHSSVAIRADAIEHDFDPRRLGELTAEAILAVVRDRIRDISEPPRQSTLDRRTSGSRKLFNDTGKLLRELTAQFVRGDWQTQSPNRLTGGQSYLVERLFRVADLSARSIMGDRRVMDAIRRSQQAMVTIKRQR